MAEKSVTEEPAEADAESVDAPTDGAYATIQLQTLFSRVLRPDAAGAGYKGLAASELRILLHLISRMEFHNKVKQSQLWLSSDLGITPQAYCRGIATLERCDFVRKLVSKKNPRMIDYMVVNPLLVRRLSAKSLPEVLKMYQSLPSDKVSFRIRPNSAQKAQEQVATTKLGAESQKASAIIPVSSMTATEAAPLRVVEEYMDLDVDLESQFGKATQSQSISEVLPEKHVPNSINKPKKRAPSPIPIPGLKTLYNPPPHLTVDTDPYDSD